MNPCLTIFCYEVVKHILIATLDSVILFPFVKWTISEVLLPLKYDFAFQILLLSIIGQVSNIIIFNIVYLLKSILLLLFLLLWIFPFSFPWNDYLWGMKICALGRLSRIITQNFVTSNVSEFNYRYSSENYNSEQFCANLFTVQLKFCLVTLMIKIPSGHWIIEPYCSIRNVSNDIVAFHY